jgi:hypothetical protein
MVESAIIMMAFLLLIFGMIDLGRGVFRHNQLAQAARQGARQAMVHGQLAPAKWNGGPWGPSTINVKADANGVPIVDAIQPMLVSCELDKTSIKVEWLDGSNKLEKSVRVTVTSPFQPVLISFFGGAFDLHAASTMPIAH